MRGSQAEQRGCWYSQPFQHEAGEKYSPHGGGRVRAARDLSTVADKRPGLWDEMTCYLIATVPFSSYVTLAIVFPCDLRFPLL